jgi:hypothetical protein
MSREQDERTLSTADFAAATEAPRAREVREVRGTDAERMQQERMQQDQSARGTAGGGSAQAEPLAELFPQDLAEGFRSQWDAVQIGFVDDPKQAVKQADELVAQVMKSLAESFSRQRSSIEGNVGGADQASTENLRVALQRYRSFFQRLLSL